MVPKGLSIIYIYYRYNMYIIYIYIHEHIHVSIPIYDVRAHMTHSCTVVLHYTSISSLLMLLGYGCPDNLVMTNIAMENHHF